MRKYLFFGASGIFVLLVALGILSISPILDNPAIDNGITHQLTSLFAKKSQSTITTPAPIATPTPIVSAKPNTTTQVLGLQTTSGAVSKDILYGLINGFRRDKKQDILVVNRILEQTAEELLAINRDERSTSDADPASVLQKYGYSARSYTLLTSNQESNWQVLASWQSNPREELLLLSSDFSEMGLAIQCSSDVTQCSTLLLIAMQ